MLIELYNQQVSIVANQLRRLNVSDSEIQNQASINHTFLN